MLIIPVCIPGYFCDGSSCTMCTGNTIKTSAGNATNCDADPPCDDVKTVPNVNHTDCGMFVEFPKNISKGKMLKTCEL